MAMNGHVFFDDDAEGASNGGGGTQKLCVARKVHLIKGWSWYDQTGCEKDAYNYKMWEVVGPCDGSCVSASDLPPHAEELVQKFLTNGVKGKWELKTLRYPREDYPWVYEEA